MKWHNHPVIKLLRKWHQYNILAAASLLKKNPYVNYPMVVCWFKMVYLSHCSPCLKFPASIEITDLLNF